MEVKTIKIGELTPNVLLLSNDIVSAGLQVGTSQATYVNQS
jgi:hypothetical protein